MALRAPLRLSMLAVVTVPLYAGWLLTRPVAWVLPSTEKGLQRLWVGNWARAVLRILGVSVKYEGSVPEGPFFLVSNHLSYVDIPVLLAKLDARFLAKSEVAGWPILGVLARSTGTLFIDRSRARDLTRVLPAIQRVLDRGPGVIVFPEGTSTDGSDVDPFKPSLFEVPVEMGLAVTCAAMHYDAPEGPLPAWEAVCWWGDAAFGAHFLQFLKQPRTNATVTFSPEMIAAPATDDKGRRKALAHAARDAVLRSFTPSRDAERPFGVTPETPAAHPASPTTSP